MLIGTIEVIDCQNTDVQCYLERMDHLFKCNKVKEKDKIDLFVTLIGPEAYKLLKTACSPDAITTKSYSVLKAILLDKLEPKKIAIVEVYKFHKIVQDSTVREYIIKLREQSVKCEFGAYRERALRDKFVCGITNKRIRDRLLSEEHLTFSRACELAIAEEMVYCEGQQLRQDVEVSKVNLQTCEESKVPEVKVSKSCFRCGRWHNPGTCPAREWECYVCNRIGHTSRVCQVRDDFQSDVCVAAEDNEESVGDCKDNCCAFAHV